MLLLSNTTAQVLQPGQTITFNNVISHTGCGECFRNNTGAVGLRARGIYEVSFHGNVTSTATGEAQLAVALGGSPLLETTMLETIATAGNFANVGAETLINNCCGAFDGTVTVQNTGTIPVTIAPNPSFLIARRA